MEPIYVCGRNGRSQVDKELQKIDRTQTITIKKGSKIFQERRMVPISRENVSEQLQKQFRPRYMRNSKEDPEKVYEKPHKIDDDRNRSQKRQILWRGETPRRSSKVLSQELIKLTRQQAIKAMNSTRLRSGNCQRLKATRKLIKRSSRSGMETRSMIGRVE